MKINNQDILRNARCVIKTFYKQGKNLILKVRDEDQVEHQIKVESSDETLETLRKNKGKKLRLILATE